MPSQKISIRFFDDAEVRAKNFPSKKANRFIEWFTYSDETIDGKSKSKAYTRCFAQLLLTHFRWHNSH